MRYNRANLDNTLQVAQKLSKRTGKRHYVFATAYGYKIDSKTPPFHNLACYHVESNGRIILFPARSFEGQYAE